MVQKQHVVLILILIIYQSFLIYLILNTNLTFFSDDAIYASLARFFLEGKYSLIFHPAWPPLYPILSALVFLFIKNWEISLRMVSALSITLMLLPLFFLSKKIIGSVSSVFFLVTIILNLNILQIALFPQTDALAAFLIVFSFVCMFFAFWDFQRYSKLLFLSSFLCGLAFLTRSEGTLFFAVYLSFLIFFLSAQIFRKKLLFKNFLFVPLFIAIFIVTISPYIYVMKNKLGYWTLSQKFNAQIQQDHAFSFKNNTTWSQEVVSVKNPNYQSDYFKDSTEYILDNFNKYRIWFFQKLNKWTQVALEIFPLWFFMIAGLGLLNIADKKLFWPLTFTLFVFTTTIPITVFSTAIPDIRYLFWTIPIVIFLYYFGFLFLVKKIFRNKYLLIIPFLLTLFFPSTLRSELFNIDYSLIKRNT